jgi:very-short-patch-repair endonuclease
VFFLYPSQLKKHKGSGSFCSKECAYQGRKMPFPKETDIERILREEMDRQGIEYKQEYSIGRYRIDFAFPSTKLAVEADGIYWHSLENVKEKDRRKDLDLKRRGWTVLHFTGDQIRESPQDCIDQIATHLGLPQFGFEQLRLPFGIF